MDVDGNGLVPVAWMLPENFSVDDSADAARIEAMLSPFYEGVRYAVRRGRGVLNVNAEWEFEPMPSSRDDAFYRRCRFRSIAQAAHALREAESKRKGDRDG